MNPGIQPEKTDKNGEKTIDTVFCIFHNTFDNEKERNDKETIRNSMKKRKTVVEE